MTDKQDTTIAEMDDEENLTDNTDTRWAYLGSVLSFVIVVSFIGMVGIGVAGYANLSSIPESWFYVLALLVLTAGGWVFGKELVESYRNKGPK